MSIWEDIQRIEALASKVTESYERLGAENDEIQNFLDTFLNIVGEGPASRAAAELIEVAIQWNNQTRSRIMGFRHFLDRNCDEIRGATS